MGVRRTGALAASFLFLGALVVLGVTHSLPSVRSATGSAAKPTLWATQHRAGIVPIKGEVPLVVAHRKATLVGRHAANAKLSLNFGLPIVNRSTLDALIAVRGRDAPLPQPRPALQARSRRPPAQVDALGDWLTSKGFRVTHVGADRLALAATATTANVEKTLGVKINDYVRPGFSYRKVKVAPYRFFANTTDPTVPARFGLQTISGLSDIDRFFTQVQLDRAAGVHTTDCGDDDSDDAGRSTRSAPTCAAAATSRPTSAALYDITGHGFDGTGPDDRLHAVDGPRAPGRDDRVRDRRPATSRSRSTRPASRRATRRPCRARARRRRSQPDHLLSILENGNTDTNTNFGSNVETALDIEAAHGVATHVGDEVLRLRLRHRRRRRAPASPNAGCNGSDVGLEDGDRGRRQRPDAAQRLEQLGASAARPSGASPTRSCSRPTTASRSRAAAGTTLLLLDRRLRHVPVRLPVRQPVRRRRRRHEHVLDRARRPRGARATTWSGGGSWCSNIVARPSWQTGAGVTANAPCPGRVIPDVSAVADPNTGVRFVSSTNLTGGTSEPARSAARASRRR